LFDRGRRVRVQDSSTRFKERQRTTTRTFRIRAEWDDVLQEEAERQGVSVNVLVNKILRRYALFTRWADKGGVMSFTQLMFRRILEELSDERLARAGTTSGPSDVLDIINMLGLPVNYDSFIYLLSEHLGGSDFCRWFTCFHHIQRDEDVFHLQHNLGRGWSIYLENYLLSSLRPVIKGDAESKIYDFAVNLKVASSHTKR
jgi:hypothetical protein